jgi:ParB family transcriptional regulator, chromosome partitioning protein
MHLAPQQLTPNPWNTNEVSPDNEAKIEASIQRLGMFKPIVVRTLADGTLQILGGSHRRDAAIRLGMDEVPVINLGSINDQKAKEVGLVDNSRYGADDSIALASLLDTLGSPEDLGSFLPFSPSDFESIFSSVNIALDDLELPDDSDALPSAPTTKAPQTHTIMRFKVPVGDVAVITEKIELVMKRQRFADEDSLTNAGNALVHIFNDVEL